MARKKEYSLADGQSKKHKPQQITSNDSHFNHDGTVWNQKPVKHKEQNPGAGSSGGKVYDVGPLRTQLGCFGLTLRDIPGDGNCLFRALGDQLEGHSMNHLKHRMDTVRYMIAHRHHFEPFVDVPFERYMENLSRAGTYAGQDAIVAFARLHQVNVVIHQLNSPLWQIQGSDTNPTAELHLSYHNGEHYSSVRRFGDLANTPPHIRIVSQLTGATEVPCCVSHSMCTPSAPVTSHIQNMPCPNYLTVPPQHPLPNPSQRSRGFIHNEDDFALLIDEVMERSGCSDSVIATEAFVDNGGDVDQAVDYLLSLSILIDPIDKNVCDARQDRQHKDVYRRVSGRRSAGAESNERRRVPTSKHLSRTRTHNSIRVITGTEPESGVLKQKSTNTVGSQPESGWESSLEGDLRFLTL